MEGTKCEICQTAAQQKCGGCHNVFYCSKEHQKNDWKNHKKLCRPFKMCHDDELGRYMVATRQIKEGEIILKELPLVWGPAQITPPVCLGCGNSLNGEDIHPCSKCGWPLCSKKCESDPGHIPECYFTEKRGEKVSVTTFGMTHPVYQCITVLRCLYQKQFAPELWEKINKLESHTDKVIGTVKYEHDKTYVAKFARKFFKLEDDFTDEELLKVCGALTVNCHEVPLSSPAHIGLYNLASIFEHRCKANCYKTFSTQRHITFVAGVPIEKGEHLSICYTDPLWGTLIRQKHLAESKFFSCTCDRCLDVTEFGTYFSILKCQKDGCGGYVLPKSFLVDNLPWICKKCKSELTSDNVHETLEKIGKDLHAMEKGNTEVCKMFLERYNKMLPENHFYMIDVKLALAQMIGQNPNGGLIKVSDEDLELKVKLCTEIRDLMLILAPGEKRLRGAILFEIHAVFAELGRRRGNLGSPEGAMSYLMPAKYTLSEAVECLKHEPDVLDEGKLYRQAKENLVKLEMVLGNLAKAGNM